MGILDTLGEVAGAVAAVEAAKKLDPNAGLFTEGAAAIAGYEGAGKLESVFGEKHEEAQAADANSDDQADQADQPQA